MANIASSSPMSPAAVSGSWRFGRRRGCICSSRQIGRPMDGPWRRPRKSSGNEPVDRRSAVGGRRQQPRNLRHGKPDWPCAVAARWNSVITVISETLGRQSPPWQAGFLAHVSGGALWHVAYPGGQAERLTGDLIDYDVCCTDVAADGRTMTGIQNSLVSDLWIANVTQLDSPRQITRDSPVYRRHGWLPDDDTIVYRGLNGSLHAAHKDGRIANLPLADGHRVASGVSVCSDGRYAVFQSTPGYSVWRVGLDRIEAVRLTSGHIDSYPVCSADGQSVLFSSVRPSFPSIWVAIGGGEPTRHPAASAGSVAVPHGAPAVPLRRRGGCTVRSLEPVQVGRRLTRGRRPCVQHGRARESAVGHLTSLGSGREWTRLRADAQLGAEHLAPAAHRRTTNANHPLHVRHDFSFAWSPDGKWLSLASGASRSDVVLISGAR